MNKKRIMIILSIVFLIMVTGYAAFSSRLTINGTASIESNWKVLFTKIEEISKTSGVTVTTSPNVAGTEATFYAGFKLPGDKIIYQITLSNEGTLDAIIENIQAEENGGAIYFHITGIKKGDILEKKTSKIITIEMGYSNEVTGQPNDLVNQLELEIKCVQYAGQTIPSEDVNIKELTVMNLSGVNNVNLPNSAGRVLTNYKIYGNMVQNGTSSIDSPSTFTFLGESEDIKIKSYSSDLQPLHSYTINLEGHEPLRSVDNYADYIDFANQRIVRYIVKREFVGTEIWNSWDGFNTENTAPFYWSNLNELGMYRSPTFVNNIGVSSHFLKGNSAISANDVLRVGFVANSAPPYISFRAPYLSIESWKNFLAEEKAKGTPVTVYYVLINPVYEEIDLPTIKTAKGEPRIEVEGNVGNINLEISYYKS